MHGDTSVDDGSGAATWLRDDHRIILYTLVSLALVVGGHRTWREYHRYRENAARRAKIMRLVESSRKEKERERKVGLGLGGEDAVHASPPGAVAVPSTTHDRDDPGPEMSGLATEMTAPHASSSKTLSSSTSTQDLKKGAENVTGTKRHKERRKRGRDVYKEVLKQERKKSSSSSAPSTSQPPSNSRSNSSLQVQTTSGSDADASRSRSRSSSRAHSRSRSNSRSRSCLRPNIEYEDESAEDTPRPGSKIAEASSFGYGSSPPAVHGQDQVGHADSSSFSILDSFPSFKVTPGSSSTNIIINDLNDLTPGASVGHRNDSMNPTPITTDLKCRTPTPPLTHSGPSSTSSTAANSVSSSDSNFASASSGAGSPALRSLNLNLVVEDDKNEVSNYRDPQVDLMAISQPIPSVPVGKGQPSWLSASSGSSSGSQSPSRHGNNHNSNGNDTNSDGKNGRREHVHAPKTPSSSSAASFAVSDASASASLSGSSNSGWDNDFRNIPTINGTSCGTVKGPSSGYYTIGHGRHGRRGSKSPPPPPRFRSLSRPPGSGSPYYSNSLPLPLPLTSLSTGVSPSPTPPPHTTGNGGLGLGSYRNAAALESARRREEEQRKEVERCKAEIETMRTRWNEDVERGRRREAELQAQLQLVTSQMHALSLSVSQMQMHPHLYLAHQASHTVHPPNHAQQPQTPSGYPAYPPVAPLPSIPGPGPGLYGYPGSPYTPGSYPYTLITTLPHMAPRSTSGSGSGSASGSGSGSGSPAREYAPGPFDVVASPSALNANLAEDYWRDGNGAGNGGTDGDGVSEELAEAILKRPGSIGVGRSPSAPAPTRSWSGSASGSVSSSSGYGAFSPSVNGAGLPLSYTVDGGRGSKPTRGRVGLGGMRSASVAGRATSEGFTFASLSELGNPQPRRGLEHDRSVGDERENDWLMFDTDGREERNGGAEEGGEDEDDGEGIPRVRSPDDGMPREDTDSESRPAGGVIPAMDDHEGKDENERTGNQYNVGAPDHPS